MKTSLIITILLFGFHLGFTHNSPEGLTQLRVYVKSFRVYNSTADNGKPGQKPNVIALRLDFNRTNQEVIIKEGKIVPQLFIKQINDQNEWVSGRIPAEIYRDDDGEYIAAIRTDNLERYFAERTRDRQWNMDEFRKEISRLEMKKYWKLSLICEHKIQEKDHITNDLGFTRTRITPDGFFDNSANKGEIELKFHIGELGEVVKLSDIGDKLYLLHKSEQNRLEVIKDVRIEKVGEYYMAAMNALQLTGFMKKMTGRDVTWNKKTYEEFVWSLQESWKLYILSKHDKRYDNYNFKDFTLEEFFQG